MRLPDYDLLADITARCQLPVLPAELHGLSTGLLIAETATPVERYLGLIMDKPDSGDVLTTESQAHFQQLYETTREQLQAPTLEFELLLPDEDDPLPARMEAACEWARGCLYGLMEQGVQADSKISEDLSGFIHDLAQISQGGYQVTEDEDAEVIYSDLLEYLRMGSLMTQEELQPIKAAPQEQLH